MESGKNKIQHSAHATPPAGKGMLRISLFLFLLFFANLLIGTGNISFHWGLPPLESVAEGVGDGDADMMDMEESSILVRHMKLKDFKPLN